MWKGIKAVRPDARLGDVGHSIERPARRNGYSDEAPQVLHWGKPQTPGSGSWTGRAYTGNSPAP